MCPLSSKIARFSCFLFYSRLEGIEIKPTRLISIPRSYYNNGKRASSRIFKNHQVALLSELFRRRHYYSSSICLSTQPIWLAGKRGHHGAIYARPQCETSILQPRRRQHSNARRSGGCVAESIRLHRPSDQQRQQQTREEEEECWPQISINEKRNTHS